MQQQQPRTPRDTPEGSPAQVRAGANAAARGPDWAYAAARFGLALSVPVAASVLLKLLLKGTDPDAAFFLLAIPWTGGLIGGWWWAWLGWHGWVTRSTLRVTTWEISGRTGWPFRRWRTVRLDALTRVRYYQSFNEASLDHYFSVSDQAGGQVMVHLNTRNRVASRAYQGVCHTLYRALYSRPTAQASLDTRWLLYRASPQWSGAGFLRDMAIFLASSTTAFVVSILIVPPSS